jgi:hypothetical protein
MYDCIPHIPSAYREGKMEVIVHLTDQAGAAAQLYFRITAFCSLTTGKIV